MSTDWRTEAVFRAVRRVCVSPQPRAVVVTGSVAREEGTWVRDGDRWKLLGDVEFLMVYDHALPPPVRVRQCGTAAERALAREGLSCRVDLSAVRPGYLRKLRPAIFSFELRSCGAVIAGDEDILRLIPAFTSDQIPLEDGFRLLANRTIELLGAFGRADGGDASSGRLQYATVKYYLDMATSLLLFQGGYAPSYRARAARLEELPCECQPFEPEAFLQRVKQATAWKLGDEPMPAAAREFLDEAPGYGRRLWRWELLRLAGGDEDESARQLWAQWMRRQTAGERLRGGLSVVRRAGWGSWKNWPRWINLFRKGSPRRWIYQAAEELLREFSGGGATGADEWNELYGWLPQPGEPVPDWKSLSRAVYANYRDFLVGTVS